MARTSNISESTAVLRAGDTVVLYTDGVTEGRHDRSFFGEAGIAEVLDASADLSAQGVADALVTAVLAFQGGSARDDIAVVVLKAAAAAQVPA